MSFFQNRLSLTHVCAAATFVLFFSSACFSVRADVSLPALISDNMVLEQRAPVNVWGTADPGEKVVVKLGGRTATAITKDDGKWAVKLDGLRPGGPFDMTITGKNTTVIRNVAVGEVWVCAGASNMEFKVANVENAAQEITAADHPMLRMFTVSRKVAAEPQTDCHGKWEVCDPQTVKGFSAVGYFFGRELNQKLKTPIGLIHASCGATPAEAWMPTGALEAESDFKPILEKWQHELENYPAAQAAYEQQLTTWNAEAQKAKAAGQPVPRRPNEPRGPNSPEAPAGLFNGMIAPVIPYSVKGVVWYQGEANTGNPKLYRKLFPTLIGSWRKAWNAAELPFLFAQLSTFLPQQAEPSESNWAELREAQAMALKLPKTGMAVTVDIGSERELHPKNKQEVGLRLGLIAEATVYEKGDVSYSGPVFSSMKTDGNKVRLLFKQTNGGLVDKNGPPLKGFAIAGEDRKFVWADAAIQGDRVVVQSESVAKPAAVRYAWANSPECDLFNKAGLPAAPFRTDTWDAAEAASSPSPAPSASPARSKQRKARKRLTPSE